MALRTGEKLGAYEITGPLGKGGMGEVYRGRDTKLDREVAIKILPGSMAHDPERLARFDREARALAALNHPNIAQIYAVESNALIMELVPGETLAERMKRGPVPLDEPLGFASQMAEALAAAHDKGIIHRDFKPGNVMVTPDGVIKVLDFGLVGRAAGSSDPNYDPENSPTLTMAATQVGVIMGTAAYMAPEQASGKPVDKRADIWAFGVVLWEMLSGKRLFEGETVSHVMAAVLTKEPDLNAVPERVRPLVARCLEKDPKKRLRDVGDAMGLVREPMVSLDTAAQRKTLASPWMLGLAGVMTLGFGVWAFPHFREAPPTAPATVRMQYTPDGISRSGTDLFALSPDGTKMAFTGTADGRFQIFVRDFADLEAKPLVPFAGGKQSDVLLGWSPDGRFLAFATNGTLFKVEATGGTPQPICTYAGTAVGVTWNRDGVILMGSNVGPILRVSAAGGTPEPAVVLGNASIHVRPTFLPDGRHFLYTRVATADGGVYIGDLSAKPDAQSNQLLVASSSHAEFIPDAAGTSGDLLFMRDDDLFAQRFDWAKLKLSGEPISVAQGVGRYRNNGIYSASPGGMLAFRTADGSGEERKLRWFDRQGREIVNSTGDEVSVGSGGLSFSPDGDRVAFQRRTGKARNLWLLDAKRGSASRFSFGPEADNQAVWSPDGSQIAFSSRRGALNDIYRRATNGAGDDELLLKTTHEKIVQDWSGDGRFLLYQEQAGTQDLWVLPLTGADRKPFPYLQTEFTETNARFSPNGKWIAYESNESGQNEVYVRPFPDSRAGKWQVSQNGGAQPQWSRNGNELFFRGRNRQGTQIVSMAVDPSAATFQPGALKVLFELVSDSAQWSPSPDGQRFAFSMAPKETQSTPFTVVWNGLPRREVR